MISALSVLGVFLALANESAATFTAFFPTAGETASVSLVFDDEPKQLYTIKGQDLLDVQRIKWGKDYTTAMAIGPDHFYVFAGDKVREVVDNKVVQTKPLKKIYQAFENFPMVDVDAVMQTTDAISVIKDGAVYILDPSTGLPTNAGTISSVFSAEFPANIDAIMDNGNLIIALHGDMIYTMDKTTEAVTQFSLEGMSKTEMLNQIFAITTGQAVPPAVNESGEIVDNRVFDVDFRNDEFDRSSATASFGGRGSNDRENEEEVKINRGPAVNRYNTPPPTSGLKLIANLPSIKKGGTKPISNDDKTAGALGANLGSLAMDITQMLIGTKPPTPRNLFGGKSIDGAYIGGNGLAYFLGGSEFVRYDGEKGHSALSANISDHYKSTVNEKVVPNNIDAAFSIPAKSVVYIFNSDYYYKYSLQYNELLHRSPIKSGFKEVPTPIMAAVHKIDEKKVYLFTEGTSWKYDVSTGSARPLIVKQRMSTRWPGVPDIVDAALHIPGHTLFFRHDKYYVFDDELEAVTQEGYLHEDWPGVRDKIVTPEVDDKAAKDEHTLEMEEVEECTGKGKKKRCKTVMRPIEEKVEVEEKKETTEGKGEEVDTRVGFTFEHGIDQKYSVMDSLDVYLEIQAAEKAAAEQKSFTAERPVDAVVVWDNGKLFFFSGKYYKRYDAKLQRVDGMAEINKGWPGVNYNFVDAVYNNGRYTYFMNGNEYYKFKNTDFHTNPDEPKSNVPKFGADFALIDGAVSNDGIYYLFRNEDLKIVNQTTNTILNTTKISSFFPGVPSHIDGVMMDDDHMYFFKGSQFIKYDFYNKTILQQDSIANGFRGLVGMVDPIGSNKCLDEGPTKKKCEELMAEDGEAMCAWCAAEKVCSFVVVDDETNSCEYAAGLTATEDLVVINATARIPGLKDWFDLSESEIKNIQSGWSRYGLMDPPVPEEDWPPGYDEDKIFDFLYQGKNVNSDQMQNFYTKEKKWNARKFEDFLHNMTDWIKVWKQTMIRKGNERGYEILDIDAVGRVNEYSRTTKSPTPRPIATPEMIALGLTQEILDTLDSATLDFDKFVALGRPLDSYQMDGGDSNLGNELLAADTRASITARYNELLESQEKGKGKNKGKN